MDLNKRNFSEILEILHHDILNADMTRTVLIGNATLHEWADFIDKNRLDMSIGRFLMSKSGRDIFLAHKLLRMPLCEIEKFNHERGL